MKFIHCADLHLDSKMEGLPQEKSKLRREEVLRTFEKLCDYASSSNVSAVIIAGDMFDTPKVTIKTRDRVMQAISKNSDVDFIYLSGNHDDENFLKSMDVLPVNLKVIGSEWTYFNYGNVVICGVTLNSLNSTSVYDYLSLDEKNINIVSMHGQIVGYKSNDNDCETISIPRLKDRNIDYLALGHIHTFSDGDIDLRGKYAYAGCLEGRGFDELGDKGFVMIDVDENNKLTYQFERFSSRNIYETELNIDNDQSWYSFMDGAIEELKCRYNSEDLVKVILKGEHKTEYLIDVEAFANRLNEEFFFGKVYDRTVLKIEENDYINDKSVRGEFVRSVWESDLDEEMKNKVIMCGLNALKGEI